MPMTTMRVSLSRPFSPATPGEDRSMDRVLATARGRLLALKSRHDAGTLDAAGYESERRIVERELGEHLLADPEAKARPSGRLVAGLAVAVLAIALLGYWKTGSPSLARVGPGQADAPAAVAANGADTGASGPASGGLQQIAAMVEKLAARMKEHPDDAEGWHMLARSYSVLGRFGEALPAYKRAAELQPANPVLLADYADAVAASTGSVDNPESTALIARSLAADPAQPKALALAGTIAFDRGDYNGAIARWQQMADVLPANSEMLKQVQASIAEARQRAGSSAPARAPATNTVAASGKSVSGTVTLAPGLAAQAAPNDTVFVFARAVGGGRMPLAVQRARVADLPLSFRLDDSMAMTPTATLSSAPQVIVGARISKSGNAMPQAGDLAGEAAPLAPSASGVAIRIDSVHGSR
jgi:cytochrome c-type biogenesis protein CcmH